MENAEKVVKPPKNPDTKKYRIFSEGDQYKAMTEVKSPILKQPRTLINKIGSGMPYTALGNSLANSNRETAPKAPPIPVKT